MKIREIREIAKKKGVAGEKDGKNRVDQGNSKAEGNNPCSLPNLLTNAIK